MKTKYRKSKGSMLMNIVGSCLLIAAMLVLGASAVQANIVYHDNFNGSFDTSINGQAPDTAPGDEVWGSGTGVFRYDGEGAAVLTYDSAGMGGTGRSQHLPLTIESGLKYTLTARIKNTATEDSWIAIGWAENNSQLCFTDAAEGNYWMLWRGNDQLVAFKGPKSTNPVGTTAYPSGVDSELDVRIILDQLADAPTAYFQYKNPSASVWTESYSTALSQTQLNAITRVGFAANAAAANDRSISSFTLEAIPEPASGMLFIAACGLVWFARRKMRA